MNDVCTTTSETRFARGTWLTALLPVLAVLALAVRPISNDDLWWQLSRGRAVLERQLSPSLTLLAGDELREADWLGGVPFSIIYRIVGFTGLMGLKVSMSVVLAVWCWQLSSLSVRSVQILVTLCLVMLTVSVCEPTSDLWNLLGLLCAGSLASHVRLKPTLWNQFRWGILTVAWANLGSLPILIFLPLVTEHLRNVQVKEPRPQIRDDWWPWLIAVLALCLTPRGALTYWDAIRQLLPMLVESQDVLRGTVWRPIWAGLFDVVALSWYVLGGMGLIGLVRGRNAFKSDGLLLVTVLSLGCWSRMNALILSVWLARFVIETRTSNATEVKPIWIDKLTKRSALFVSETLCLAVLILATVGHWPFEGARLGWGLNRRLETRLLVESLAPNIAVMGATMPGGVSNGTAHCVDIRAAGMLAWSKRGRVKPFLVPHRALLNGRLREEVLLNREIETGWLKSHRRSDGTDGGWWLTLRTRNTLLLLTSSERTTLIRSLEPTIWKPLALDSPVIAYALAGYPTYTARLAEVAAEREFVDRDRWTYQPEPAAGYDQLWDGVGLITGWPDADPILRQAAVFRAMNLPLAGQRVLRPLLQVTSIQRLANGSRVRRELVACQLELAEREVLATGQISPFRGMVLRALSIESPGDDSMNSKDLKDQRVLRITKMTDTDSALKDNLIQAVDQYLTGDPHAASGLLLADHPDIMYARAMLEWEAGHPVEARNIWSSLNQRHPDSRAAMMSRHVLETGTY